MKCLIVAAVTLSCGGMITSDDGATSLVDAATQPDAVVGCTPYLRPATPPQTIPQACNDHCDDLITATPPNAPGYDLCTIKCSAQISCPEGFTCATVTTFDTLDYVCYPSCASATCPVPMQCDADHACR
jgi:hypothetical protein